MLRPRSQRAAGRQGNEYTSLSMYWVSKKLYRRFYRFALRSKQNILLNTSQFVSYKIEDKNRTDLYLEEVNHLLVFQKTLVGPQVEFINEMNSSIIKSGAGEAVSAVGNQMIAVQILQLLTDLLQTETLLIQQSNFDLDFVVDIGHGGHETDAIVVSSQRNFLAVKASDDSIQDIVLDWIWTFRYVHFLMFQLLQVLTIIINLRLRSITHLSTSSRQFFEEVRSFKNRVLVVFLVVSVRSSSKTTL